jgi:molybdate transport system substrate-binding protein
MMSNSRVIKFLLILLIVTLAGCTQSTGAKQEITVSAAASLKDALSEIKDLYIKESNNKVAVHLNFASSGTLKTQIEQGAPTDVFLSASEEHFNKLLEQDLIDAEYHKQLLKNRIVLISPASSDKVNKVEDLPGVNKISLGIPESVPAGKYGKETLEYYKIWNQVENNIVFGKDVRQVLTYVETGNVDAGFVYQTDALQSDKVKVIEVIDDEAHAPIFYPAGIVKGSNNMEAAKGFYQFLQGEQARNIFKDYGFVVVD